MVRDELNTYTEACYNQFVKEIRKHNSVEAFEALDNLKQHINGKLKKKRYAAESKYAKRLFRAIDTAMKKKCLRKLELVGKEKQIEEQRKKEEWDRLMRKLDAMK